MGTFLVFIAALTLGGFALLAAFLSGERAGREKFDSAAQRLAVAGVVMLLAVALATWGA